MRVMSSLCQCVVCESVYRCCITIYKLFLTVNTFCAANWQIQTVFKSPGALARAERDVAVGHLIFRFERVFERLQIEQCCL